jgi:hypothetical protein
VNTQKSLTSFVPSVHGFHFPNGVTITPKFLRSLFDLKIGVCGGMCWASLDRYFKNEKIPDITTPPLPNSGLYKELLQRQIDTTSSWRWFRTITWQNTFDGKLTRLTQEQEWPKVKESLDRGTPIVLCLIRARPVIGLPTNNHQVLAVGYDVDFTTTHRPVKINIYDSNRPDEDTTVLYITERGSSNRCWKTYIPDTPKFERCRGFFTIAYQTNGRS